MRQSVETMTLAGRGRLREPVPALCYLFLMMMNPATARALALSVLFLCAGPACLGNPPLPGYLPDPTASSGDLMDGVWVFQTSKVLIRMSPMTDEARAAYILEDTGSHVDPFGPRADGSTRFVSFLLEILNLSLIHI